MVNDEHPQGKVISIVRENDGVRAIVSVDAAAVCPRCAAGKGCGAGIFGASASMRRIEVSLPPEFDVSEGDTVSLSLGSRKLLQAAIIVYGWPLLGAIAGASLAYLGDLDDAGAAASALAGLAVGVTLARIRLGHKDCMSRFSPTAIYLAGRSRT